MHQYGAQRRTFARVRVQIRLKISTHLYNKHNLLS